MVLNRKALRAAVVGAFALTSMFLLFLGDHADQAPGFRILQKKKSKMFFDNRPISFTHIPKCGGVSFGSEMEPKFNSHDCFATMKREGTMNVVFLRSPRKHVRSQHGECYFDPQWGLKVTKNTLFPRTDNYTEDFSQWLHHFSMLSENQIGPDHDFNCYDPRELQTRYMSCLSAGSCEANHALVGEPPSLEQALINLNDADFVGLTDFYHESICMLHYRREEELPVGCNCNEAANKITHVHETHGVPNLSDEWTADVIELVDSFTLLDRALFKHALNRFQRDLLEVEQKAGVPVLCDRSKMEVLSSTYPPKPTKEEIDAVYKEFEDSDKRTAIMTK